MKKLSKKVILNTQNTWAHEILEIGDAYRSNKDYKSLAIKFINKHYGYSDGIVLFKPTLASVEQFRDTFDKALSYFIAGNPIFPEDLGFAIQPWTNVKFQNAGILILGRRAVAMGNYFFTNANGNIIKVEYTFGYFLNSKNEVKINLHHSSIPYTTEKHTLHGYINQLNFKNIQQ